MADIREYTRRAFKQIKRADEPELEELMRDLLFELQDQLSKAHGQSPAQVKDRLLRMNAYWVEACKLSDRDGVAYSDRLLSGLLLNLVSNPAEAQAVFDRIGIAWSVESAKVARAWVEDNWVSDALPGFAREPETVQEAAGPVLLWKCTDTLETPRTSIWLQESPSRLLIYEPTGPWELQVQAQDAESLSPLFVELSDRQIQGLQRGLPVTVKAGEAWDAVSFLLFLESENPPLARRF